MEISVSLLTKITLNMHVIFESWGRERKWYSFAQKNGNNSTNMSKSATPSVESHKWNNKIPSYFITCTFSEQPRYFIRCHKGKSTQSTTILSFHPNHLLKFVKFFTANLKMLLCIIYQMNYQIINTKQCAVCTLAYA